MNKKRNIAIITILAFSFVFEGIFSNFISTYSFFSPLFVLMSLIIIYPFLINDKRNYYKCCFIIGLLYDLIYTDTIIVHAFLFLLFGFLITKINVILTNNNINVMVVALIMIVLYRIVLYCLLILTSNVNPNLFNFIQSIYLSLLANIIYIVVMNIITDKISYKFKIYKGN